MTLVSTYMEGFAVITEPLGSVISGVVEPLIQLCCLNASIAIKPVLEKFQSVVITSGGWLCCMRCIFFICGLCDLLCDCIDLCFKYIEMWNALNSAYLVDFSNFD